MAALEKTIGLLASILLLAILVPVFSIWAILQWCSPLAGRSSTFLVSPLLIAFAAVLAFGTYRTKGQTFRAQYSLHAMAIVAKLREMYPKVF